ncbi:MAG: hypothetical protein SVN78_04195 [Deferribacterota bacterium]|nr:hypothetical protein [Deferribacterota bacterium]
MINNQNYYQDIIDYKLDLLGNKIQFLASKLVRDSIDLDKISSDFYQINIYYNVELFDKEVSKYVFYPLLNDRFRHIIWTYKERIVKEEVYDLFGKLLYTYSFINLENIDKLNVYSLKKKIYCKKLILPHYNGFKVIYAKCDKNQRHIVYSDGLNKFSFFRQHYMLDIPEEERIVFGNYVYSVKKNNHLYLVVGTIPFREMHKIVNKYIKEAMNEES